jgi:hypothetical protein
MTEKANPPPPPPGADPLDTLKNKLREYLTGTLTAVPLNDEKGTYGLQWGSTKLIIIPEKMQTGGTVVHVMASVTRDSRITPELMKFLLEANANFRFGAFCLTNDGGVIFKQGLLGEKLDREELQMAIMASAVTADQYDDKIIQMAGGKRATD